MEIFVELHIDSSKTQIFTESMNRIQTEFEIAFVEAYERRLSIGNVRVEVVEYVASTSGPIIKIVSPYTHDTLPLEQGARNAWEKLQTHFKKGVGYLGDPTIIILSGQML